VHYSHDNNYATHLENAWKRATCLASGWGWADIWGYYSTISSQPSTEDAPLERLTTGIQPDSVVYLVRTSSIMCENFTYIWLLLSDYRAHNNQEVRFSSAVKCKKGPRVLTSLLNQRQIYYYYYYIPILCPRLGAVWIGRISWLPIKIGHKYH